MTETTPFPERPVHRKTRIGHHVHLEVTDLERAIRRFRDALGFEPTRC